jgi:hypothetical protein
MITFQIFDQKIGTTYKVSITAFLGKLRRLIMNYLTLCQPKVEMLHIYQS